MNGPRHQLTFHNNIYAGRSVTQRQNEWCRTRVALNELFQAIDCTRIVHKPTHHEKIHEKINTGRNNNGRSSDERETTEKQIALSANQPSTVIIG